MLFPPRAPGIQLRAGAVAKPFGASRGPVSPELPAGGRAATLPLAPAGRGSTRSGRPEGRSTANSLHLGEVLGDLGLRAGRQVAERSESPEG